MPCALRASRTSAVPTPPEPSYFLGEPLLGVGAKRRYPVFEPAGPFLLDSASRILQRQGESLFTLVADRARVSFQFRGPLGVRFGSRLQQLV